VSQFFTYIASKSTTDPYLPTRTVSLEVLARDVADAFSAISGGRFEVGKLAFYPVQRSVPNHLLCDGREVSKASFPELYRYLGDVEGTPVDAANFVLPNYLTGFAPATTAARDDAGRHGFDTNARHAPARLLSRDQRP
jgi:hypothetical protein